MSLINMIMVQMSHHSNLWFTTVKRTKPTPLLDGRRAALIGSCDGVNESEEESVCLHYHVSSLAGTPPPPVTVAESLQESLPQESAVEFQQSANVGVHDRSSTYSPTYLPSVADRVADEYTDVVLCRTYYSDSIHIDMIPVMLFAIWL